MARTKPKRKPWPLNLGEEDHENLEAIEEGRKLDSKAAAARFAFRAERERLVAEQRRKEAEPNG